MWQMEVSRHLAQGTLSTILGESAVRSDEEVIKSGYTESELLAQFNRLSPFARSAMQGYAAGVNRYLTTHSLPHQFADHEDSPWPWTPVDSAAICIRLFQEFGKGGAGELRNLAFIDYAQSQPGLKNHVLDALDDFAWQNDPASVTTVKPEDDPQAAHPPVIFPTFDRNVTHTRLSEIPVPGLVELLPAVRLAERTDSRLLAESQATPFRTGSYCVVVAPRRSSTGNPLLLSGPQMGFTSPSILHEISIDAPGLHITGADVPGVPGVVVGKTDRFAWGVTSGVADTEDIVWSKTAGSGYLHEGKVVPFAIRRTKLDVKDSPSRTIASKWTIHGPVVLESGSKNVVFSRHSAYRGVELQSFDALLATYDKGSAADIVRAISTATMNFNFFYATKSGDIGYRYAGLIPKRAPWLDPRLPTPDEARFRWRGFLSPNEMPHVCNPKSGVLANWNNKPVAWFPNGDTPAWGSVGEADVLFEQLGLKEFSPQSLEVIVHTIALESPTWPKFKDLYGKSNFDGLLKDQSIEAKSYQDWYDRVQSDSIRPTAGSFLTPDIFKLVAQPTVVWNALHQKTKLDFMGGRDPLAVTRRVETPADPSSYRVTPHIFKDLGSMLYTNRGTYIQIVELTSRGILSRSVLPPGESDADLHRADQLSLANTWSFKPMHN
jgi:penicillin amidase